MIPKLSLEESLDLGEEEQKGNSSPPPKKSVIARAVKLILSLCALLVLLIAAFGVALEYYFPREQLRIFVQRQLSQILEVPVTIGKMDFSLFRGFQIRRLAVGNDGSIVRVKSAVLDYDLTQLIRGNFIINQLVIDTPELNLVSRQGVWNFQSFLQPGSDAPSKPSRKMPEGALPIPISLNLKEVLINNVKVKIDMDRTMTASLEGLNLRAEGKAGASGINLTLRLTMQASDASPAGHNLYYNAPEQETEIKTQLLTDLTLTANDLNHFQIAGTLNLNGSSIRIGNLLPAPDLKVELKMAASLEPQSLTLEKLKLNIGDSHQIVLSAEASQFLSAPRFRVLIESAAFDIGKLLEMAPSAPPLDSIQAAGVFHIDNLEVSGTLADPQQIEVTQGNLLLDNFSANYLTASLEKMRINIALRRLKLENLLPQKLDVSVDMQIGKGSFEGLTLHNFEHQWKLSSGLSDNQLAFSASANLVEYVLPTGEKLQTGFQLEGAAAGDFFKGDFRSFNILFKERHVAEARLTGQALDFGRKKFSVAQSIELNLDHAQNVLPSKMLEGAGLTEIGGSVKVHAELEGRLDQSFQPLQAKVNVEIELKDLDARASLIPLTVKGLGFKTSLSAQLISRQAIKISPIDIEARFQGINALDAFDIGPTTVHSTIALGKPLSFPLTEGAEKIPLSYKTRLRTDHIHSSAPPFSLAKLTLDADLQGDFHPPADILDLKLEGELSIAQASGLNQFETGGIRTSFAVTVNDRSLSSVKTTFKTRVLAPTFKSGDLVLSLEEIGLESVSHQNLQTGTIDIQRVLLRAPPILTLEANGRLENWGKTFSLESQIPHIHLANLWRNAPAAIRSKLEGLQISGTAAVNLSAQGELPQDFPLKSLSLPVQVHATVNLDQGSLSLPAQQLSAENLGSSVEFHYNNGFAVLTGQINVPSVRKGTLKAGGVATWRLNLQETLNPSSSKKNFPPFETQGNFTLDQAFLSWPDLHMELEDIAHSFEWEIRENRARVSGRMVVDKLFKRDILGEEWLTPQLEFIYSLDDWNKLTLHKQELTIKNRGATFSLDGRIEGLKPFLAGKLPFTPENLANRLDVELNAASLLKIGDAVPVTQFFKADGSVGSRLTLKLKPGKTLAIEGRVEFNHFNATLEPSLKVNDVDGAFLFDKKLQLGGKNPRSAVPKTPTSQRGYFNQLRDFSLYKDMLRIGSIQYDSHQVSHIRLDPLYKDNQFRIEKFLFETLSGSVAGNLFLQPTAEGPRLNLFVEFAGLDFQRLIDKNPASRETEIDGNMTLGFRIHMGDKRREISLDELEVKVLITRIGDEALDRALLFLDPEESKPALVNIRSKLKLATPHQIALTLKNGNLNLDIWLKNKVFGDIFKAPGLKRIPVANLKHFKDISKLLQNLSALNDALQYLAAQGISFDNEKGIVLF